MTGDLIFRSIILGISPPFGGRHDMSMAMNLSLPSLIGACTIVAISAVLQGSVGFGFSIVAAPLLLLIDRRLVPGPLLLAGLVLIGFLTLRERHSIDGSGLKWAFAGLLPGTLGGALILATLPETAMSLFFGGLVLLAVVMSVAGLHFAPTPPVLAGAGLLSGLMSATSSISGPPIALVYQHKPGASLRGTLSGYFLASTTFSILALRGVGHFGYEELTLALPLLPAVLFGFWMSKWAIPVLDRGYTRPGVLILSSGAALIVIFRTIF
jgi:uncharacterized membrane protein YfcA